MTEPDLNLLIALDALLTEGSVIGAARRLGLSASAMSRTLGRLRAVTGDPLLVRAGRQMVLTPHAEQMRQDAQNALSAARRVLRPPVSILNLSTLVRIFTLRTNEGFVAAFGAALIAAAAAVAPGVCLCFAPKPEKSAMPLREGIIDLEIGVLEEMGPEIRLQALFRDRFIGVVRKGHPLEAESRVSAARYADFGHVIASRRGRVKGPVDDALAALGLSWRVAAVVPNFPAALTVAQSSDLVALVPASLMMALPDGKGVFHTFELPVKTNQITISQMWHPRVEADPAHRWLRQLVLHVCQQQVARER
ncbi:LysR family transcriptional regulator [Paramixta manurensis]|uniref:LysR family transcriptional regulator n=1 Tax=Paramixta manurensis TaxID=2740817 RepID=A0A6M8U8X1_9GAMM|nr:LysR family transcriptional regulator [Erwiniaceae bacterium PD-1]